METQDIDISVDILLKMEIQLNPELTEWEAATEEARELYIKTQIKEEIVENIDDIVNTAMKESKIFINKEEDKNFKLN